MTRASHTDGSKQAAPLASIPTCASHTAANPSRRKGTLLIAAFKAVKGLLLLGVGFGLLNLVHRRVADVLDAAVEALHLSRDSRIIHGLVVKVDTLEPQQLLLMSLISLAYGVLLSAEGIGLWFEYRWAAYLTICSTSLLIPLELYELVTQPTIGHGVLLIVNVEIVWYIARHLRREAE